MQLFSAKSNIHFNAIGTQKIILGFCLGSSLFSTNLMKYLYSDLRSYLFFILFPCREFTSCFKRLGEDENCRVVVVSGTGKMFCAGRIF